MTRFRFTNLVFASAFVLALGFTTEAQAFVELNTFYFSDAMSAAATTSSNRMNIEAALGFAVDNKNRYLVGWGYNMMTSTDASTTTATYSSTQMGPRFIVGIDKNNEWTVGLAYYLVTNASYDSGGGSSVTWKGTALKFDLGYSFKLSDSFMLGIRGNYSSASYTEQLVGSTTYSAVGYSRTSMYPSLYTIYYF